MDIDMSVNMTVDFSVIRMFHSTMRASHMTITMHVDPFEHDDTPEQFMKAKDRFKYWIENVVSKSLMFNRFGTTGFDVTFDDDSTSRINNPIMLTPGEPSDELLGFLLMAKFNAFGEGKVACDAIDIRSDDCDGVAFTLMGDPSEILPEFEDWMGDEKTHYNTPWWDRNDGSTLDAALPDDADISDTPSWAFSVDERLGSEPKTTPKFVVLDLTKK